MFQILFSFKIKQVESGKKFSLFCSRNKPLRKYFLLQIILSKLCIYICKKCKILYCIVYFEKGFKYILSYPCKKLSSSCWKTNWFVSWFFLIRKILYIPSSDNIYLFGLLDGLRRSSSRLSLFFGTTSSWLDLQQGILVTSAVSPHRRFVC